VFFISLAILSVILGTQVILRSFVIGNKSSGPLIGRSRFTLISTLIDADKIKVFKHIFIFAVIIVFLYASYLSYQQYQAWSQGEVSKNLLPPYTNINYFIFYSLTRFFAPHLISLIAAILFFFSARILNNKKYEERFFEQEEYYFGALSIFLVGHPGWLFYFVFLIFIYLLIHISSSFIVHSPSFRVPLYHLWLPAAIFVILISKYLQGLFLWQLLKF